MSQLFHISEAVVIGLHAMFVLGASPERAQTARQLARRLKVSEAHLAKVCQRLARAGLLRSVRGPGGGCRLAQAPAAISLLHIFEAIEGPVAPDGCVLEASLCRRGSCVLRAWRLRGQQLQRDLASTTLADASRCLPPPARRRREA